MQRRSSTSSAPGSSCLDTFILLLEGDLGLAATYLVSVVVLSLASAWLGYLMATRFNRLPITR
nr:hypothetical protein [Mesorhizobium sp.]